MKRFVKKVYWILASQLGLDPLRFFRALVNAPWFIAKYLTFKSSFPGNLALMPCLHDRHQEGGDARSEYFWQDLLVARLIHQAAPRRHVDIGSRIDGFVAHVASFREIEVLDVRPITMALPGIQFKQADLMDDRELDRLLETAGGSSDSVSCLHALEHFGLGRYGDRLDPKGWRKGLRNLARLVENGGTLYLSVPIGTERVEFNANWVFDPRRIVEAATEERLSVESLSVFSPEGGLQKVTADSGTLTDLAVRPYALGIFTFRKAGTT
jgi:hypothetical protein